MRFLKILLPLMTFLFWSAIATADYDPTNPPEPGVNFTLTTRCVPENSVDYLYPEKGIYSFGSVINVNVAGRIGYRFVQWEDEEGNVVSTESNFYFTMPASDITLIARFIYDPTSPSEPDTPEFKDESRIEFRVNPPQSGWINPDYDGLYEVGSQHYFYVSGFAHYSFINWTRNGEVVGTTPDLYYTIPYGDHVLVANFEYDPDSPEEPGEQRFLRKLSLKTNPENAADVNGAGEYLNDSYVYVDSYRKRYYNFINWTDDTGAVVSDGEGFQYIMPNRNVTLTANYSYEYDPESPGEPDTPNPDGSIGGNMVAWPRFGMTDQSHVMILCETEGATIYYTLDESDPTEASPVYTEPIFVGSNLLVKAVAYKDGMEHSPVRSYRVSSYRTATPVYSFENRKIKITSATPGAVIRYTLDFSEPNSESEIYTAPFEPEENCRIKSYASKEGLTDSPVSIYVYRRAEHMLPVPTAEYAEKHLTLSCADPEAIIRYTIDGSVPGTDSPLYETPIFLNENCTVRFFAMRENFFDSDEATFLFVKADHQVKAPVISYEPDTGCVTMTTETEDAEIRYTTDGTSPESNTGELYTGPITVIGNTLFMARAFRSDLLDSELTRYAVSDQKVPMPEAVYGSRSLTLSCDDSLAEIYYTMDGTEASGISTRYSSPIPLDRDAVIRFRATRAGFEDSDENQYEFVLAKWQENPVYIDKDFRNRRIFISHPYSLPAELKIYGIMVTDTISTPIDFEVMPEMSAIEVTTLASDDDHYDSEPVIEILEFHQPPRMEYNGHAVTFTPMDEDPYPEAAERWGYFNDNLRIYGSGETAMDILEFGRAHGHIESDYAFRSEDSEMEIDYFNTGRNAGAINSHRIEEAFGNWGDKPEDYEYLRIVGDITSSDLRFIATLPNLHTLHLDPYSNTEDENYDSIFADSRIMTLSTNFLPIGMLKGMPRLTTLLWGLTDTKMPEGRIQETGNPNLLLWLTDAENAPEDANNVIIHDYIGEGFSTDPNGPGIKGYTDNLHLIAGYPYNAHMPFDATNVSFEKNFSLPTELDVCQGWETIILPFEPETIISESVGEIQPFATWDGKDESPKPFWLYHATPEDWEHSDKLVAGIPYIISMPNNEKAYIPEYNISGKVTFLNKDCTLGTEETFPQTTEWIRNNNFEGSYMAVDPDESVLALNSREPEGTGRRPGSLFTTDITPLPFECFVRTGSAMREIPVFRDWSGVEIPLTGFGGLLIETPAPGIIRVSSEQKADVTLHSLTGVAVRYIGISAGETVTLSGLPKGIYLLAGRKVMVR